MFGPNSFLERTEKFQNWPWLFASSTHFRSKLEIIGFSPIKGKYQVFLESNLHFLCIRISLKSYLDQTFITRCDRYRWFSDYFRLHGTILPRSMTQFNPLAITFKRNDLRIFSNFGIFTPEFSYLWQIPGFRPRDRNFSFDRMSRQKATSDWKVRILKKLRNLNWKITIWNWGVKVWRSVNSLNNLPLSFWTSEVRIANWVCWGDDLGQLAWAGALNSSKGLASISTFGHGSLKSVSNLLISIFFYKI